MVAAASMHSSFGAATNTVAPPRLWPTREGRRRPVRTRMQGIIRRIKIETNNIKNLLGKLWVVAYLEGFQPVRLKISRLPDLRH